MSETTRYTRKQLDEEARAIVGNFRRNSIRGYRHTVKADGWEIILGATPTLAVYFTDYSGRHQFNIAI